MNQQPTYRVLVVDDDPITRRLLTRALASEGFICDEASDGAEGKNLAAARDYQIVVVDLLMPLVHGHELATHLLAQEQRPFIAMYTGVIEPKLVRDVVARGVDDLTFKPVDYPAYAAKLKALVNRAETSKAQTGRTPLSQAERITAAERSTEGQDIRSQLLHISQVLPISSAALHVERLAAETDCTSQEVAAAIMQDGSLVAEVIRLANSAVFNPTSRRVTSVEEAVLRIGHKRIRELAIATSALASLTKHTIPWLNTELLSQQSIAAGLAVKYLVEEGEHQELEDGLLIGALVHGLGRVALAGTFADQYDTMLRVCHETDEPLVDSELRMFGETHVSVMSRLLEGWSIPAEIYRPIKYVVDRYESLAHLPNIMRSKVELIKIGLLLGQLAVRRWESWDCFEFPPAAVLKRLRVEDVTRIISMVRADLVELFADKSETPLGVPDTEEAPMRVEYCNLSREPIDFVAAIGEAIGQECVTPEDAADVDRPMLVNCIRTPSSSTRNHILELGRDLIIVTTPELCTGYARLGSVITVPGPTHLLLAAFAACAQAGNQVAEN